MAARENKTEQNSPPGGTERWTKIDTRLVQKARVFDLHVQRMRSPDGSYEDDFYFLDTVDFVNIIPITKERQVVLVEQYRHGIF